jgi:hypothetical protein
VTYEADARFLQALILGQADPLAADVPGRIAVLRAQYTGTGDAGILDLICARRKCVRLLIARATWRSCRA